jgi:hypothetical protein
VAVLGFHQPREQYTIKLFFQWLLQEPNYEKRVVYVEFQTSFSGDHLGDAENIAVALLTKIDFELDASTLIFGEPKTLQIDVMGPAAQRILQTWKSNSPSLLLK